MLQQNRKAVLGLALVLIGLVLLFDNLRILPRLPWWIYEWYTVMIVVGLVVFLTGNRGPAFVVMGIGVAFLLQDLFYFSWRDFWPLILIIIGLSFVFRKRILPAGSTLNENYFDSVNIFGGGNQTIRSHKLEGGRVTTIFGGAEIDLREAKPLEGAAIEVNTIFGGVELFVPAEWRVRSHVTSIFGAFEDKRKTPTDPDAPEIIVRGLTLFGGGEVKS